MWLWPCPRLTVEQVQEALDIIQDRFYRNTKGVNSHTPLTLEQCDKALSDAVKTFNQVKRRGQGALKKAQSLKVKIDEAYNRLKELQGLGPNKVQMSLTFAEEWRSGKSTNCPLGPNVTANLPDRMHPQSSNLENLQPIDDTPRSSGESFEIPERILQINNPSSSNRVSEEQPASNTSGSVKSNLSTPCVGESSIEVSGATRIRRLAESTTSSTSTSSDTGFNTNAPPRTEHPPVDLNAGTQHIFTKNVDPLAVAFKPPR
ncbi:hypothetical protein BGX34_011391, partial [Mortierella sp. NVP85]